MGVTIADITFDRVRYDADGDVLYPHRADPSEAIDFDESPEGHALRFDRDGRLIGVTLIRPRWHLEHSGEITITIPERVHLTERALADALG